MTKGNFTISYLDVNVYKHPKEMRTLYGNSEYSMVIMNDNNIGHNYPIPKADAVRIAKKIAAFKAALKKEMMAAARKVR